MRGNEKKLKQVNSGDEVTAEAHNALIDATRRNELRPGRGYRLKRTAQGTILEIKPSKGIGGTPVVSCPLGALQPDPENEDKFILTPGFVQGNLVEKSNITPAIGDVLYLEIAWTATKIDDVLQEGGTLGTIEVKQAAAPMPIDDELNKDNLTGKHRRILGQWIDDGNGNPKWIKDACGGYNFKMCSSGVKSTFLGIRGGDE